MVVVALVVCQLVMLIAACYGLYQAFMALSLTPWLTPVPTDNKPQHRFAILIFAKDEAQVIASLVQSLKGQAYPARLFDVFVTADNCSDATAAIAAENGAIVWERHDTERVGKGYALHWFFDRFSAEYAGQYDACVVFDADNVVETGFLAAMNRQLNQGADIALGYRMGKNPTSSWVAGVTTLFWLLQTRFSNRSRVRRGLPCTSVGGTGFMFSLDVLPDGQWNTSSTSEDIEFTLNAIADGRRITLATDAVFYDEQPLTLAQSIRQRYRWTVGAMQSAGLCLPKLWRSTKAGRLSKFDAVMFCVGIPIAAVNTIVGPVATVLTGILTGQWVVVLVMSVAIMALCYLITGVIGYLALRLERASWPGAWKAVVGFPFFMLTWVLLYVVVLFHRSTTWHQIPHVEALSLDQIVTRRAAITRFANSETSDPTRHTSQHPIMGEVLTHRSRPNTSRSVGVNPD